MWLPGGLHYQQSQTTQHSGQFLTTAPEEGHASFTLAPCLSLTGCLDQATPSSDTMARKSILEASERGRNLIPGACSFATHAQYRSRQNGHIAYMKGATGPQQESSPPAALTPASSVCLLDCSCLHPASECDCCISRLVPAVSFVVLGLNSCVAG